MRNPLSLIQRATNRGLLRPVPILYLEVLRPPKPLNPRHNGKVGHPTTLLHGARHSCRVESEGERRKGARLAFVTYTVSLSHSDIRKELVESA